MICDHGEVFAHFRRVLVALALTCFGLVLTQSPVQAACSCEAGSSVRTQARDADVVFSGVLAKQDNGPKVDIYTLDVERVYRGRVPETPVAVASARGGAGCGLGQLQVDRAYVVFATRTSGQFESGQCAGTGRATPEYVAEVEDALGPGNEIPKPQPPQSSPQKPAYERVLDSDPPTFTRLAAPGGAMVLVGLLGLILFRKRG